MAKYADCPECGQSAISIGMADRNTPSGNAYQYDDRYRKFRCKKGHVFDGRVKYDSNDD